MKTAKRIVNNLISIYLFIMIVACSETENPTKQYLTDNWEFSQVENIEWNPASVPGNVHIDLLNNKMIDDPFYRNVEKDLQWIGEKDWQYSSNFIVHKSITRKKGTTHAMYSKNLKTILGACRHNGDLI